MIFLNMVSTMEKPPINLACPTFSDSRVQPSAREIVITRMEGVTVKGLNLVIDIRIPTAVVFFD